MADKVVVYHSISEALHCDDGFAAAVCAYLRFGASAEYHKGIHGKVLPLDLFDGKDVYFLDFCYDNLALVEAIAHVCKSLTIIDHHPLPFYLDFSSAGKFNLLSDRSEASCVQAYRYFMGKSASDPLPTLLHHVRDNEMWRHEDPYTKPYIYKLRTLPHTFDQWSSLLYDHGEASSGTNASREFIKQGFIHQEQIESLARTIADAAFSVTVDGVQGLAVNAPRVFASIIGEMLTERSKTFGACFFIDRGTADVELRSLKGGFDVKELASRYGGGGYQSAAHFSLPVHRFFSMFAEHSDNSIDTSSSLLTVYHGIGKYWEHFQPKLICASPEYRDVLLGALEQDLTSEYSDYGAHAYVVFEEDSLNTVYPTVLSRLLYRLAIALKLPRESNTPSILHKIFPYKIGTEPNFSDEEKVKSILDNARKSKGRAEEEMAVDNLLATVKLSYKAVLPAPACTYTVSVSCLFGEVNRLFRA